MLFLAPIALIATFYICISNSTSSLICFSAFVISICFILVSLWILCDILTKDVGPRAMQEIAEVIREGSEGFFVTQYGTIFKYAFMTSAGLFVMYAARDITGTVANNGLIVASIIGKKVREKISETNRN